MDKEELVVEIRNSLNKFIDNVCDINMAMLIKDINSGTYTFLLSAKYFDLLNEYESIKIVAEHFFKDLSKEAFSIISRINIVSTLDTNLEFIYGAMNVTKGIARIKNCNFFGVQIDDAIIFESNRD